MIVEEQEFTKAEQIAQWVVNRRLDWSYEKLSDFELYHQTKDQIEQAVKEYFEAARAEDPDSDSICSYKYSTLEDYELRNHKG